MRVASHSNVLLQIIIIDNKGASPASATKVMTDAHISNLPTRRRSKSLSIIVTRATRDSNRELYVRRILADARKR
jgi:hypothetical protein